MSDVCHAHAAGRRPLIGRRRRARDRPLVDGQLGHQLDVGTLLAQRRTHGIRRTENYWPNVWDEGGALSRHWWLDRKRYKCVCPRFLQGEILGQKFILRFKFRFLSPDFNRGKH